MKPQTGTQTQQKPSASASTRPVGGNAKNISTFSSIPSFYNARMQPHDSLPANKWKEDLSVNRNIQIQKNPYADPTQISKGNTVTTAGGSFALYDKTGGTALFSYDPITGVITINGSLVSNTVNSGTYMNIILSGTNNVLGTMQNGFYGTPQITGGTFTGALSNPTLENAGSYQVQGTNTATGSFVYVKTVNFSGSTTTLGTVNFVSGLITVFS